VTAPGYCGRCGKPLRADDRGERRCENGHPQAETASLVAALRDLVPVLRDVRADVVQALEDQGVELRSLREEVEAQRAERGIGPPAADEWVELPEMARRLKVSADWLRRNAAALGGRHSKKGGRWKFHPPTTLGRFGATARGEGGSPLHRRVEEEGALPPRPLPAKVPLLPVKDRAA
jgi:hypothetical protein